MASLYLGQKGQDNDVDHNICKYPFPAVSRFSKESFSTAWPEPGNMVREDETSPVQTEEPGARRRADGRRLQAKGSSAGYCNTLQDKYLIKVLWCEVRVRVRVIS